MTRTIYVFTEGATERWVGKVLWNRHILDRQASPKPDDWSPSTGTSRDGFEQVLNRLTGKSGQLNNLLNDASIQKPLRVLLIFDREDRQSPRHLASDVEKGLQWNDPFWQDFTFQPVNGWDNLFEHRSDELHLMLHVSNAAVDGISRWDFDGYILQLLQGPAKQTIAQAFRPENAHDLLKKAEEEIPQLMQRNNFPWTHAKSWLYAYITVFQFRGSHVAFAEEVVRNTPEGELKRVFASLIEAWKRLI